MANDMGCSAAYALMSACDRRVLTRTSTIGSIGVILMHVDEQDYWKKEGMKITIFRQGDHKAEGNPFEDMSDETIARINADSALIMDIFVETVARNLASNSSQIEAMKKNVRNTQALTYMGENAVEIGLATAVMSEDQFWQEFLNYLS
jgi:capsid assembly protease